MTLVIQSVDMNAREQFIYDIFKSARRSIQAIPTETNFYHYTHVSFGQDIYAQTHMYLSECAVVGSGWHARIIEDGIEEKQIMVNGVAHGKPMKIIKERAVLYITDEDAFARDFTYLRLIGTGAYDTVKMSPDKIFDFVTK